MAAELLEAVVYADSKVKHEVYHDLESFVWVLAYVISRSVNERTDLPAERRKHLRKHFVKSFGFHDVYDIHTSRLSCKPLIAGVYGTLLPEPMIALLKELRIAVNAHFALPPPQGVGAGGPGGPVHGRSLTHDILLDLLDNACHSLSSMPVVV